MDSDDLEEFFAEQQTLMAMSDDDWSDYEGCLLEERERKRVRLTGPGDRREDEHPASSHGPAKVGHGTAASGGADHRGEDDDAPISAVSLAPNAIVHESLLDADAPCLYSDGDGSPELQLGLTGLRRHTGDLHDVGSGLDNAKNASATRRKTPTANPSALHGDALHGHHLPNDQSKSSKGGRVLPPTYVSGRSPIRVSRQDARDRSNVTTPPDTAPVPAMTAAKTRRQKGEPKGVRARLKEEKARKAAEERARHAENAKEKLMTPLQYAMKLQMKFQDKLAKTPPEKLSLTGKSIFYVSGDMKRASKGTRERMDFIAKKGGKVVPVYHPETVTHIITDSSEKTTLKALGLKSLKDIPEHIPTLKWIWLTGGNCDKWGHEVLHAAFAKRINADSSKAPPKNRGKGKDKVSAADSEKSNAADEFSRIEQFTSSRSASSPGREPDKRLDEPSTSSLHRNEAPNAQDKPRQGDPLAEFYDIARRDQQEDWPQYVESDDEDNVVSTSKIRYGQKGFTCDLTDTRIKDQCPNDDVIKKLQELMEIHQAKPTQDDKWRVFSYGTAIRALRNYPERIRSADQAQAIQGIGEKTAHKIMEIIMTGDLRRINCERTEDVEAMRIFSGVYGVGPSIAYKWYVAGCRTLEDVKARKGNIEVSMVQQIGIKFYDDINSRMPRSEAEAIFNTIKPIALQIDPDLFIEIMGSFRRGKADCGDIDILITRPDVDGKTHTGVLKKLLKELHMRKIVTEDLAIPDDFNGLEATYRGLCQRDALSPRRRIDILTVPYVSRGAALMYYTGDDIFNRAIRYKAGKMGYSLNQRGLYADVTRDPKDRTKKWNKGTLIASETEEDIFKILGVPWQEPHERVRAIS